MVELAYRGQPPHLSVHSHAHAHAHDESAASAGLESLALGIHADRTSVAAHDDDVRIRLWFGA